MSEQTDFDLRLTAYLEARSTSLVPDEFRNRAHARVDAARQRPGWLNLEWWLPVRVASRATRAVRVAVVIATVLLLVLAIALGVLIGSRHRLPPPIGPATPGLITFDLAGDIYVANADGAGLTQLTSGPDVDTRATWSPDGTTIAYESRLAADLSTSLIIMGADGSHRTSMADHLSEVGDLAWSPDSRRVAFSAHAVGDAAVHVFLADIDHASTLQLGGPDLQGIDPSWSPDGTMIAFKHIDPCCSTSTLWLVGAGGSDPHELPNSPKATSSWYDSGLWRTAWSPDGKRLAVLAAGDGSTQDAYPHDVYVVGSDGGALDITNSLEDESWPSWSPDGTRIAFVRTSTAGDPMGAYVVVDPDGSNPVRLTGASVTTEAPVWSPDGTRLLGYAYDPAVGSNDAIAVFDVSGRSPTITIPEVGLSNAPWQSMSGASWQRLAP